MFTNLAAFGGNFFTVLNSEFKKATKVNITLSFSSLIFQ